MRSWRFLFLAAILAGWAEGQTVTFDFDNGMPPLAAGQSTPFDQTSGGITARFSSPSGAAFSIQTDSSTGWKMSRFSGKYLSSNNLNLNTLVIRFSQPASGIALTFATSDFHQAETTTSVQLTASMDVSGAIVGSGTARGTYGGDTMPTGTLSFQSSGSPFNIAEITIPRQALAASSFLIDNVTVTPATATPLASVLAASFVGGSLAPLSIVTAFGQVLAASTQEAAGQPLPVTLANTTVTVKDSTGAERQAPLLYVSPSQINYLVPDGAALGPAVVSVISQGRLTAAGGVNIDSVAPGLFTANFDGRGAPAAVAVTVAPDLTQSVQQVARCGAALGSCVTVPIDLGPPGTQVVLTLYGTGIRGRSSLAAVTAKIGGLDAPVQYAGAQAEFAGLDQVNVSIPRTLAGRGEVDLALTVDGKAANTVRVSIK